MIFQPLPPCHPAAVVRRFAKGVTMPRISEVQRSGREARGGPQLLGQSLVGLHAGESRDPSFLSA